MLNTRWHKIAGDLSLNKLRTFLVILAISIGVFGISVVSNSYSILLREMDRNYLNTNPSSASLVTDTLNAGQVQDISSLPYIKDAQVRNRITGRIETGENEWKDIQLFIINDFNDIRLDSFTPEEGSEVPGANEILIERKALKVASVKLGDIRKIRIPGGKSASLKIAGSVHAPGLAPAWMEGCAYGYITPEAFRLLGGEFKNSELKILVSDNEMDKDIITQDVQRLKEYLGSRGIKVYRTEIPSPGRHPHYTQMATFLYLMEIFGILAFLLSSVLVANMISSLIKQQTRQIGIMKAVGAGRVQIIHMYLMMVALLSLPALLISIPAGIAVGRGYASLAAGILNFKIYSSVIPAYIFLIQIAVGLIVPILTALYPILFGSKITVREAITDYGIKEFKKSRRPVTTVTGVSSYLPRPFLLSLRNTFRKKGRLIFTILVMAAGGTAFITAMNIFASMYSSVDKKMDSTGYDLQITLDQPEESSKIEEIINKVPDIEKAEAWSLASTFRVNDDGTYGNSFNLIAPNKDTRLMSAPPLYQGRWLDSRDTDAIVINQRILTEEPDIKLGDKITLKINGQDTLWRVVGISKELFGLPAAYVNSEYLNLLTGSEGFAKSAVVKTAGQDTESRAKAARLIEKEFESSGIMISSLLKMDDYRTSLENHLLLLATFLIIMSILVVIVGGLGLATTVSVNTLERTREIGIMRSIGSTPQSLSGIIVTEGIIIGILSWFISVVLSLPLSRYVSYNFGLTFFSTPLEFAVSIPGYIIWLLIVIVFAALASLNPSLKASRMQVREALAYE